MVWLLCKQAYLTFQVTGLKNCGKRKNEYDLKTGHMHLNKSAFGWDAKSETRQKADIIL